MNGGGGGATDMKIKGGAGLGNRGIHVERKVYGIEGACCF